MPSLIYRKENPKSKPQEQMLLEEEIERFAREDSSQMVKNILVSFDKAEMIH
jgi:hypothetical protein